MAQYHQARKDAGRMEAASCHTGEKGQSQNGFQQDLCSSAPSKQRNNVETWGGLCSKTAPQEALYLSGFTHFTLQKKAQFNSTPSSPQTAFRHTSLLQGPHRSPQLFEYMKSESMKSSLNTKADLKETHMFTVEGFT